MWQGLHSRGLAQIVHMPVRSQRVLLSSSYLVPSVSFAYPSSAFHPRTTASCADRDARRPQSLLRPLSASRVCVARLCVLFYIPSEQCLTWCIGCVHDAPGSSDGHD